MIRTSIHIGNTPISDHDFTRVSLSQKVGGHHQVEIGFEMQPDKGFLLEKAKTWIGQTITIGFDHHSDTDISIIPVRPVFKGILTSLELGRKSGAGELVVKGQSPTIVMDDGPNTRSFTNATLQEIVDKVIKPYKGAFPDEEVTVNPARNTSSIPYTVQYKESNFNFINRLANRYGEWLYYDGLEFFFGKLGSGETINLDFGENELKYFDLSVEALPIKTELKAYDYKKDEHITQKTPENLSSNELAKEAFDIGNKKIFNQEAKLNIQTDLDEDELEKIAKRREEIAGDEIVVFNGVSGNCSIVPGAKIHVKDENIKEDYGEYIITRVSHNIGQGGAYSNNFEAVPVELNLAPLSVAPDPPFCETQLAKVVDTNDEEAIGRVKVECFWQKGSGETSPWIRVASPYMGADKGFYIVPEVDDQVLVAFENNNPDKPYVLSGMYHGKAKPEWFDAENRYKGFKSKGKNQMKFDDKAKSINISAPNEMMLHAGNKITLKTGGKEESEINIDVGDGAVSIVAKHVSVKAAEAVRIDGQDLILLSSAKNINAVADEEIDFLAGKTLNENAGQKIVMTSAEIEAEASAKMALSGAKVDVNGSAMVNVKGGLIKLN
jgi:uncharacterized protein involved in type VI secretion and phage assembly